MSFVENIRSQVKQRWAVGVKKWTEDDATRGCDGHESTSHALEQLYGKKYHDLVKLVYVDYGDHMISLYEIDGKLVMVEVACDCDEIREGIL